MNQDNGATNYEQAVEEATAKTNSGDSREPIEEIAGNLHEKANSAKAEVARQLHTLAATLRKEAQQRQLEEAAKEQVEKISASLNRAAAYIDAHTIEEIGKSATDTARNSPWKTALIVFIAGLLIGITLNKK